MPALSLQKGDYTSAQILQRTATPGAIVFDNNTGRIYVGQKTVDQTTVPIMFGSNIQNIAWNSTTKILTITSISGDTVSISLAESGAVLSNLRTDINSATAAITALNGSGAGSVSKSISDSLDALDGTATIASKSGDIVTLKAGVSEVNGVISNSTSSDITLAKIASTGSPADISVTYSGASVDLQTALNTIKAGIDSAATAGAKYIVCSNTAAEIPDGVTYYGGVTGTLAASSSTSGTTYLVKDGATSYEQFITTQDSGGTYSWTSLGSTQVNFSGYVKYVTVNGRTYDAGSGSTITLSDVLTTISGGSEINNSNTTFISIIATPGTASNGQKSVSLSAQAKTKSVSTATAANDGFATAADVKDYVDSRVIFRTWTLSDIQS